jgi:hypothetical protein
MKINMHMESESSRENQRMIHKWAIELASEYKIAEKNLHRASFLFASDKKFIPLLIQFVKNKYGLTLSHFHIADGTDVFATGFDITEDEHLTKLLWAR